MNETPAPMIRLACYVSAGSVYDFGCFAVLALGPAPARTLLAKRVAFAVAKAACPDVAHVDVWDYRVDFFTSLPEDLEPEGDLDDWTVIDPAPDLVFGEPVRTELDMAELTGDGVSWTALTKGDAPLETPQITWDQLERVTRGDDPFSEPHREASFDRMADAMAEDPALGYDGALRAVARTQEEARRLNDLLRAFLDMGHHRFSAFWQTAPWETRMATLRRAAVEARRGRTG